MKDPTPAPGPRLATLERLGTRLLDAGKVVLTTHVNADGDGVGSQVAIAAWLEARGVDTAIVNPTPLPAGLRFLIPRPDLIVDAPSPAAAGRLREADLVLVLDTSEPKRVAPLGEWLDPDRTIVIDHHPAGPEVVGRLALQDPSAAATGELVYDLIRIFESRIPERCALPIYVALVSDTGSFRFGNTTPRVHRIAAELLAQGIDPEMVFQHLYATFSRRRLDLLQHGLASLRTDPEHGITWMTIPHPVVRQLEVTSEDFEGLVDHARSLEGTRVAMLFRETRDGETKISLRSTGDADVNRIAREFGGGGHARAAGAEIAAPPEVAVQRVLRRVREELDR
jgi:bifunctional oligoribonuclease and PAP phosphatase NrnA